MTQTIKTINLVLEGWGVLTSFLAVFILLSGFHMEKRTKWYFIEVFLCLSANLLSNITGILFKGKSGAGYHLILIVADFFEFFFGYLLTYNLSHLLIHTVETSQKGVEAEPEEKKKVKKVLYIWHCLVGVLFGLAVLLLFAAQWNHMYYIVDDQGYYHRQDGFWLSQAIAVVSMLLNVGAICHFRKLLGKEKTILFLILIVGPILALIIQIWMYGVYFALLFAVIASVILLIISYEGAVGDFLSDGTRINQNADSDRAVTD